MMHLHGKYTKTIKKCIIYHINESFTNRGWKTHTFKWKLLRRLTSDCRESYSYGLLVLRKIKPIPPLTLILGEKHRPRSPEKREWREKKRGIGGEVEVSNKWRQGWPRRVKVSGEHRWVTIKYKKLIIERESYKREK